MWWFAPVLPVGVLFVCPPSPGRGTLGLRCPRGAVLSASDRAPPASCGACFLRCGFGCCPQARRCLFPLRSAPGGLPLGCPTAHAPLGPWLWPGRVCRGRASWSTPMRWDLRRADTWAGGGVPGAAVNTLFPEMIGIGSSQRPAQGMGVAPSFSSASSSSRPPFRQQILPVHTRGARCPGSWRAKWW